MNLFWSIFVILLWNDPAKGAREKKKRAGADSEFVRIFSKCRRSDSNFDGCIRNALNEVRPYFKYGVPEFNIPPFDPFFAGEVVQNRGGPYVNYRLKLRNVYESGWTVSKVYKFKSDFDKGMIQYYQWFPEKYLQGEWEIESNLVTAYSNRGTFDLALYNYTQVTTVTRNPRADSEPGSPFAVKIKAINSGDMKMHINNLLKGRSTLEFLLDRIINISWRPGFHMLKPVIDDLVSTAFTKIFNDAFREFPFDEIIPK